MGPDSFFESMAFTVPVVMLLITLSVFIGLICFEKWRQRTRKSAIKAEAQAIHEEFQAIVRGLTEKPSDK